jgi:hypothetical protein
LTPNECDALKLAAEDAGIEESLTAATTEGQFDFSEAPPFERFDRDGDGAITIKEAKIP